MAKKILQPIHPGEILLEEFLEPLGLSQYRLAKGLSVPPRRINEIVHGKRAVTADTALRLARFFGTSDRFWLNLQTRFDLEREKDRMGELLEAQVEVLACENRVRWEKPTAIRLRLMLDEVVAADCCSF